MKKTFEQCETCKFNEKHGMNLAGSPIWRLFDDERPYDKKDILVTDGKHVGIYVVYKADWCKSWDDVSPILQVRCSLHYKCDPKGNKSNDAVFEPTHWMYLYDLLAQLNSLTEKK